MNDFFFTFFEGIASLFKTEYFCAFWFYNLYFTYVLTFVLFFFFLHKKQKPREAKARVGVVRKQINTSFLCNNKHIPYSTNLVYNC